MPYTKRKLPDKSLYRVKGAKGVVKAKATSKANAERQIRLLNAIDHGFQPRMVGGCGIFPCSNGDVVIPNSLSPLVPLPLQHRFL